MICHSCGREIKVQGFVPRTDECPSCNSDLHCCLNCGNYDPSAHNKCREPLAEWISDREKANFCDLFMPNKSSAGTAAGKKTSSEIRKSFDDLFKK